MSYNRPTSSNNQKRVNAAAALREQVKNGGSFSQSSPLSTSPIGSMSQRGRPSSAPNVNNNNMGRGLQRGALVGASNTNAISAYNFTTSNQNRQLSRRSQGNGGGGGDRETGNRVRPSSQQMQRSSFLPSNSTLNRNGDQQTRTLTRPYSEKVAESNAPRNPLRNNEGNTNSRAVAAPAPRARSSGQVRQQYLAHLGIDSSSAPTQSQSTTNSTNSSSTNVTDIKPGSGGLAGKSRMPRAQSEPVQTDSTSSSATRNLPGTSALDASPPVMQSLSGGNNVWWKRAFTKGDGNEGSRGRGADGQRRIHFHDQVEVRYVPLHSDYSQRVRQKYWNNAQELWEMAARNSIEYASEGYDFRNVVEEENFTRWGGQLIHPAHVQGNPSFGMNRTR